MDAVDGNPRMLFCDALLQTVTERYRTTVIDLRPSQPLKKAVSQWEDEVPAQLRPS